MNRRIITIILITSVCLAATLLLPACGGTKSTTTSAATTTQTSTGTLVSIKALPSQIGVAGTQTAQIFVTTTYSDGTQKTVTGNCTFKSSDENICKVENYKSSPGAIPGTVTGYAQGQATITVTYTEGTVTKTTTVLFSYVGRG